MTEQKWERTIGEGLPVWGRAGGICREGNGTPLQYSCLENPIDGGAWQAAGKTRDLFNKMRDTKALFHAKMGSKLKQKVLRRGGKNTQKNYTKKICMTQITTMM